jgi:chromosomal replication initiation ATPase DnaA
MSVMAGASPPRQLAFRLDHAESFAREDFLQGASNENALALIEHWPDWPDRIVALVGPAGAGKSHLASIWAAQSGARFLSARALHSAHLPSSLATGALVVEDVADGVADERALFHLLNLAREENAHLLFTARKPPTQWNVALPDLASRLRVLPAVVVAAPDDTLLRALIVKLFADRQLAVDESLVGYLAGRVERSFAGVRSAVETLDREALHRKRPVNRALAAELYRDSKP